MNRQHLPRQHRQRGVVLIVSLIFLMVLTLVAVTGMQTTSLEEKMAGNLRDRSIALHAAESALREAEAWLAGLHGEPDYCSGSDTDNCVWAQDAMADDADREDWWQEPNAWGRAQTYSADLAGVAADGEPRFLLEEHEFVADGLTVGFPNTSATTGRQVYRITARGTGSTGNSQVMLQTMFSKRYN